jgi:transcription elongation factor Elf1
MLFPSRFLVKNCRRCGKNVRIEKKDLKADWQSIEEALNEEYYCPFCGQYIGKIVLDKQTNYMDIAM